MISIFEVFKVGIGPSSSHTNGPMTAAYRFVQHLKENELLDKTQSLRVELFGSLGATGKGHGSDKAVILGLQGHLPENVDPEKAQQEFDDAQNLRLVLLNQTHSVSLSPKDSIIFHRKKALPYHPNGMMFFAFDENKEPLLEKTYYSIGGGFVLNSEEAQTGQIPQDPMKVPYPFRSGEELLALCAKHELSISDIMLENEKEWHSEDEIYQGLLNLWHVMQECVERGCTQEGTLPGGMKVRRRASKLHKRLCSRPEQSLRDPLSIMDWVNLYALAVNEENAAGGRVVTAPTNGAAGVIPSVLHYCSRFTESVSDEKIIRFFLTAGAIGWLYKENASISGADVGCQGEVGVACSMAAGALAEFLGGTPEQVENAAEIGMEHNLGLTCDPVGGLVQVPCIERNAMGAMKALNAARMALHGDGNHHVSLDKVIKTMKDTGADMKTKYKETSRGGLAVNVIEC